VRKWIVFLISLVLTFSGSCNIISINKEDPFPRKVKVWSSKPNRPIWIDKTPSEDSTYIYFIGLSGEQSNEQLARKDAGINATNQFVQHCGVDVRTVDEMYGLSSNINSDTETLTKLMSLSEQRAEAFVSRIKSQEWYIEQWKLVSKNSVKDYYLAFGKFNVPLTEISAVRLREEKTISETASSLLKIYQTFLDASNNSDFVTAYKHLHLMKNVIERYKGIRLIELQSRLKELDITLSLDLVQQNFNSILETFTPLNYSESIQKHTFKLAQRITGNSVSIRPFSLNGEFEEVAFAIDWQNKVKHILSGLGISIYSDTKMQIPCIRGTYRINDEFLELSNTLKYSNGREETVTESLPLDWLPDGIAFEIGNENLYWIKNLNNHISKISGYFKIRILNDPYDTFRKEESIEIEISSSYSKPVYCTIFNFCADNKIYQIIPNYEQNYRNEYFIYQNGILNPHENKQFIYNLHDIGEEGCLIAISENPLKISGKLIGVEPKIKEIKSGGRKLIEIIKSDKSIISQWKHIYVVK